MTVSFSPRTNWSEASVLPLEHRNAISSNWHYEEAFSRHAGLISEEEQQTLKNCHVAIPGLGGVGGVHLITLTRLGIGKFSIADADEYSVANFNRQYGANVSTVGRPKADVMAEQAQSINPELDLKTFNEYITADNVDAFLDGVDILVDGVDFFSIEARRMLFREARRRGIWAITAGPIGFSTAWLVFDPNGMSFDEYFDIRDEMTLEDKLVSFAVGLAPKATQASYTDLSQVDIQSGAGPSVSLACQLASGVTATEVFKVLTKSPSLRPVPYFHQFDSRKLVLASGKLRFGNRGPIQRLKRTAMRWLCDRNGLFDHKKPASPIGEAGHA